MTCSRFLSLSEELLAKLCDLARCLGGIFRDECNKAVSWLLMDILVLLPDVPSVLNTFILTGPILQCPGVLIRLEIFFLRTMVLITITATSATVKKQMCSLETLATLSQIHHRTPSSNKCFIFGLSEKE